MTTPGTPKKQNTILVKKRISLNVHVVAGIHVLDKRDNG